MTTREAHRRAEEIRSFVADGMITQGRALAMIQRMFETATADHLKIGADGRIIYATEVAMNDVKPGMKFLCMDGFRNLLVVEAQAVGSSDCWTCVGMGDEIFDLTYTPRYRPVTAEKAIARHNHVERGMKFRHKIGVHVGKTFHAASKKTNRDWLCIEEGKECYGHSFWDPNMYEPIATEPRVPKVGETWLLDGNVTVYVDSVFEEYGRLFIRSRGNVFSFATSARWTYVSGPSDAPKADHPDYFPAKSVSTKSGEWTVGPIGPMGQRGPLGAIGPAGSRGATGAVGAPGVSRAHDFSNPYLPSRSLKGNNLCANCGLIATSDGCTPNPKWRLLHEAEIADDTDHQAKNRRLNRMRQPAQPYRNDVAGIGAVMGGYHNVAPERGR